MARSKRRAAKARTISARVDEPAGASVTASVAEPEPAESDDLAPYLAALAPKHRRFVEEYLIDLNATQAAVRAGFEEGPAARNSGWRLMTNDDVVRAVREGMKHRSARTLVDQAFVVTRLRQISDRAMCEQPVYDMMGRPTGEYKFDGQSAARATELLGKHIGMFIERFQDVTNEQPDYDWSRLTPEELDTVNALLEKAAVSADGEEGAGRA